MTWSYSDRVSPKRQAMLCAATSFQSIIDRVLDEMHITSSDFPPGKIGAVKGYTRPEFSLVVCPDTFDLFFNSPQGYRGQYHQSAEAGQDANAELINAITDKLISYTSHKATQHTMSVEKIRASLAADSAKIWINEEGPRAQRADDISNLLVDLEVEPWLGFAKAYRAAPAEYPDPNEEIKAVDGVKAPEGTILEVKGAFIDQNGQERVAENKIDRARQIHLYGFT